MNWTKIRNTILKLLGRLGKPSQAGTPQPAAGESTPDAAAGGGTHARPVPAWDRTVHASCWAGGNAAERMMNVLSPRMSDSTFEKRLDFMRGRGCDAAHVFLVNQGDGEASGYSPWGVGKAPDSGDCDKAAVAAMEKRIGALRDAGLAVVVWLVADDSDSWRKALFREADGAVAAIVRAGLLDQASYVVLGLEMDECGSLSDWKKLRDALRRAGYAGRIGVHHTGGKHTFLSLGDIVLDQIDPKKATPSAIAKSVKALKAKGVDVVGFEYARGPDRERANAALAAGAFAVGNW